MHLYNYTKSAYFSVSHRFVHQKMAVRPNFLLRVYVALGVAVKVTLAERPEPVQDLIDILREKLKPRLDFEFTVQYEDPDFGGQLTCLVDVQELPEKGILKIIRSGNAHEVALVSEMEDMPLTPISPCQKSWPEVFPVPTFSYEVELVLQEGNRAFESSGKRLKFTRSQKHNILETMAALMYTYKAYPSNKEVCMAAEALVTCHPCLKDAVSVPGWYGWKISLKYKMGDYRSRLSRSGCLEVAINTGKRSKKQP